MCFRYFLLRCELHKNCVSVNRIRTEVVVREDELSETHFKILFLAPIRTHYKMLRREKYIWNRADKKDH